MTTRSFTVRNLLSSSSSHPTISLSYRCLFVRKHGHGEWHDRRMTSHQQVSYLLAGRRRVLIKHRWLGSWTHVGEKKLVAEFRLSDQSVVMVSFLGRRRGGPKKSPKGSRSRNVIYGEDFGVAVSSLACQLQICNGDFLSLRFKQFNILQSN